VARSGAQVKEYPGNTKWKETRREKGKLQTVIHLASGKHITATVRVIKNQGWSVTFDYNIDERDIPADSDERSAHLRAAAEAAAITAWAYSRVASVREDGNPWSLDINTSTLASGIVSFGECCVDLIDGYFGVDP
jgi:hypothetical protein